MNDDLPILSVSGGRASDTGRPQLSFTLTLSETPTAPVVFDVQTLSGTATEAIDFFELFEQGFTIPVGTDEIEIPVTVEGDALPEGDEAFTLELANLSGAHFAGGGQVARATGIIEDDDGDPRPALFVGDVRLVEGTGATEAVFPVELSRAFAEPVTIPFTTVGDSATAGSDFVARTGVVTFSPGGSLAQEVVVAISGDTTPEETERFDLVFDTSGLDLAGSPESHVGTATLLDDDSGGGFLSVLSVGAEDARSSLPEGRRFAEVTLSLSAPLASDLTLDYQTISGTAEEADDFFADFDAVTIPAGNTTASIFVRGESDSDVEGDEVFAVEVYNLGNGAVLPLGALTARGTGVVTDDDGDPRPALFVDDVRIVEGTGVTREAVFDVRLTRPFDVETSLPFETVGLSAVEGEDFARTSGILDFLPGQLRKTVSVPVTSDAEPETSERFDLVVDVSGVDLANGAAGAAGTATLLDDDAGDGSQPVLSIAGETLDEGGGRRTVDFVLSLSRTATSNVDLFAQTLSGFADENFDFFDRLGDVQIPAGDSTALFQVTYESDSTPEGDEDFAVEIANPVNAVLAGDATSLRGHSVVRDDDGVNAPALRVFDVKTVEGDAGSRIVPVTVSLSRPAEEVIEVGYSTGQFFPVDADDTPGAAGLLTFLPGQTEASIPVEVNGDTDSETLEEIDIFLSRPRAGDFSEGAAGTRGSLFVLDDDSGGAGPTLNVFPISEREGGGRNTLEFVAELAGPNPGGISDFFTENQSAFAGQDYFANSGNITFAPGERLQVVQVTAESDAVPEQDETLFLVVEPITGGGLAGGAPVLRTVGTIRDDDSGTPPILPPLVVEDITVVEPGSEFLTIRSPVLAAQPITGNMQTFPGTADPSDFTGFNTSYEIPAGSFETFRSFTTNADTLDEGPETVVVRFTPGTGVGSGNRFGEVYAIATILDDVPELEIRPLAADRTEGDGGAATPFTFEVVRTGDTSVPVSADIALVGTGTDPAMADDFATAFPLRIDLGATELGRTVTVEVAGDDVFEPDETFELALANPTARARILGDPAPGTIRDDDGVGATVVRLVDFDRTYTEGQRGLLSLRFERDGDTTNDLPVTLTLSGAGVDPIEDEDILIGLGPRDYDFGTRDELSLGFGVQTGDGPEADEGFRFDFSSPLPGVRFEPPAVEGLILDGESRQPASFSVVPPGDVVEGDDGVRQVVVEVQRLGTLDTTVAVEARIETGGPDPAGPDDVSQLDTFVRQLEFAPGVVSRVVRLSVFGDEIEEGDETFLFRLTDPFGATVPADPVVLTIEDDDAPPPAPPGPPSARPDYVEIPTGGSRTVDLLANDLGGPDLVVAGIGLPDGSGGFTTPVPGLASIGLGPAGATLEAAADFAGVLDLGYRAELPASGQGDAGALTVVIGPRPPVAEAATQFRTSDGAEIFALAGAGNYLGLDGADTYIVSEAMPALERAVIFDGAGSELEIAPGVEILSSIVAGGTLRLTLSNRAEVQIGDARPFLFDLGGNATAGIEGELLDFDAFVARLPTLETAATGAPAAAPLPALSAEAAPDWEIADALVFG